MRSNLNLTVLVLIILFFPCEVLGSNALSLQDRFAGVDIRIKVKGGGHVAQVYAIRQAIAKSLVAYYQKCKFFTSFIS